MCSTLAQAASPSSPCHNGLLKSDESDCVDGLDDVSDMSDDVSGIDAAWRISLAGCCEVVRLLDLFFIPRPDCVMGCEKLFGQTSLDKANAFAHILCTMGCWYALWSQCGRCEC